MQGGKPWGDIGESKVQYKDGGEGKEAKNVKWT